MHADTERPRATSPADGSAAAPVLRVEALTLAFGGVKALSGVGFDVQLSLIHI